MIVECDRLALKNALELLAEVADAGLHLKAGPECLRITAERDSTWPQCWLPAAGATAGAVVINARLLAEIVGAAYGEDISISVPEKKGVVVIEGMASSWTVPAMDMDAFPVPPPLGGDVKQMTATSSRPSPTCEPKPSNASGRKTSWARTKSVSN